jgi:hypothetical protein
MNKGEEVGAGVSDTRRHRLLDDSEHNGNGVGKEVIALAGV